MADDPDPAAFGCYIPPAVWNDDDLTLTQKAYFGRLIPLMVRPEGCTASNDYLEGVFGTSESAIRRVLGQLEAADYICRDMVKTPTGTVRKITFGPTAGNVADPQQESGGPPPQMRRCHIRKRERGSSRERKNGRTPGGNSEPKTPGHVTLSEQRCPQHDEPLIVKAPGLWCSACGEWKEAEPLTA